MKLPAFLNAWRRAPLGGLRRGVWRERPVPAACAGVPTMLMDDELRLLEFLTDEYYRGGAIVDAGCFLGGSTVALASGLRRNLSRRGLPEQPLIHSYDLFRIEDWTRGIYFPETAKAGDSTRALFDRNVANHASLIDVREGDITASRLPDGPIEILFIDVAKHWTVCDWITENLFPLLVPGRSVVVQQDYLYPEWTGWLQVTMEYYADEFEMLCDTGFNSVAFLLTRPFAPGRLRPRLVAELPVAEKIRLMDGAASRFSGTQAEILQSAKRHFVSMLDG
jgi:hypothetical protein